MMMMPKTTTTPNTGIQISILIETVSVSVSVSLTEKEKNMISNQNIWPRSSEKWFEWSVSRFSSNKIKFFNNNKNLLLHV